LVETLRLTYPRIVVDNIIPFAVVLHLWHTPTGTIIDMVNIVEIGGDVIEAGVHGLSKAPASFTIFANRAKATLYLSEHRQTLISITSSHILGFFQSRVSPHFAHINCILTLFLAKAISKILAAPKKEVYVYYSLLAVGGGCAYPMLPP
jgi:hypothetical protein